MSPFVTETRAVKAILAHIGVPTRPPVISPARAPPAWEEDPIQVDLGDDPLDPWLAATVTPLTLLARKSPSMDVAFGDDKMRICTDHTAHNMAILRHFVLNLICLAPVKRKGLEGSAPHRRNLRYLPLLNYWVFYRIHAIALVCSHVF